MPRGTHPPTTSIHVIHHYPLTNSICSFLAIASHSLMAAPTSTHSRPTRTIPPSSSSHLLGDSHMHSPALAPRPPHPLVWSTHRPPIYSTHSPPASSESLPTPTTALVTCRENVPSPPPTHVPHNRFAHPFNPLVTQYPWPLTHAYTHSTHIHPTHTIQPAHQQHVDDGRKYMCWGVCRSSSRADIHSGTPYTTQFNK